MRESGTRERMTARENESKGARLGHGTLMVPMKQGKNGVFLVLEHHGQGRAEQA